MYFSKAENKAPCSELQLPNDDLSPRTKGVVCEPKALSVGLKLEFCFSSWETYAGDKT